ncbi:MAG: hypothetical protein ACKVIX_09145 [Sphingomonadales bacterium]
MKSLTITLLTFLVLGGCTTTLYDEIYPSPQRAESIVTFLNDYDLCYMSFDRYYAAARSKEFKYMFRKPTVEEIKRRNLNCKNFSEFSKKKDWMEAWVEEYEGSLNN